MKKISIIFSALILMGIVFAPIASATTTASSLQDLISTLQSQITILKTKITDLNLQMESLRGAKGEVKEAAKDVKTTLQLIRTLKVGMSGDDVRILQELLASDPDVYPEGIISGYFGKLTEKAVRKLQSKLCIDTVGQVGPQTMRRINELLTEGAGNSQKVPKGLLTAPGIQKKLCATTTPDTIAPVISNIFATGTTANATQIKWTTSEKANSKVWYTTATPVVAATPTAMVISAEFVLNHSISLSGLSTGAVYNYIIVSADKSGNTATSAQQTFTTLP